MEQWKKAARSDEHAFTSWWMAGCLHRLSGRQPAGGSSVLVWTVFCWETLGLAIHVDVTLTCTNYPSIVAETVLADGCGLFQQDSVPCRSAAPQPVSRYNYGINFKNHCFVFKLLHSRGFQRT